MITLFQNEKFKVIRNNGQIDIYINDRTESLMTFKIDSHDNRLTATRFAFEYFDSKEQRQIVECLCSVLKDKMGGKEYVIITYPAHLKYMELFSNTHFKMDLTQVENRIRLTTPKKLLNSLQTTEIFQQVQQLEEKGELLFIVDKGLAKRHTELTLLAKNSGFSDTKVADYEKKGEVGYEVMALSSVLMGLVNKKGELVAFYRVADLDNRIGYMCDTWVNEKLFGTNDKQLGTAYIYKKACETVLQDKFDQLLLIAPPDRVVEFDKHFGCALPNINKGISPVPVVLAGFGKPGLQLAETYNEQAAFVNSSVKRIAINPSAAQLGSSLSTLTSQQKLQEQNSYVTTLEVEAQSTMNILNK